MSIKKVWEIIKNFNCAELAIVQEPAMAVWQEQQKRIEELESKVTDLSKNLKDRELAVLVRQERIDQLEEIIEEIDSKIAVDSQLVTNSCADEFMGVDANELAEFIEQKLKGGDE